MRHFFFIILIFFILIIYSCENIESKSSNIQEVLFKIELSKDTVIINEYVKGLAVLVNPYFTDVNSRIVTVIEDDENYPLKEDLSNEFEIPIKAFHNLAFDKENQEWAMGYDFDKSSAFGRKFLTSGNKKIRGYILEYITEEPPLDSITDKKKYIKHYFEMNVYVKDTIN